MFRVIGAFILVLSCGVAPYASAVPGDGGRDLRAQSGETKKRRAKAKEDAGIFTTGRVVCGILALATCGGAAYWYFNPEQVHGWLANVRNLFVSDIEQLDAIIADIEKTDPKKAAVYRKRREALQEERFAQLEQELKKGKGAKAIADRDRKIAELTNEAKLQLDLLDLTKKNQDCQKTISDSKDSSILAHEREDAKKLKEQLKSLKEKVEKQKAMRKAAEGKTVWAWICWGKDKSAAGANWCVDNTLWVGHEATDRALKKFFDEPAKQKTWSSFFGLNSETVKREPEGWVARVIHGIHKTLRGTKDGIEWCQKKRAGA